MKWPSPIQTLKTLTFIWPWPKSKEKILEIADRHCIHFVTTWIQRQVQSSKKHVTYNMWHTICDIQHVTYNMSHTTCHIHHVTYNVWHTTCDIQHATYNVWHTTCDIQLVTYNMWHTASAIYYLYDINTQLRFSYKCSYLYKLLCKLLCKWIVY